MKILFMCVANSARSQIAEGLAKSIFGSKAEIQSAGSEPKSVNPFAARVLKEIGINIESHRSKSMSDLMPSFLVDLDYVITLCAEEVCPVLPSTTAKKFHWPFPDPAGREGSDEDQIAYFRQTREVIKKRIEEFSAELSLL